MTKGRNWLALAAQIQYLCELDIDEAELEELLDDLSFLRTRLDEFDLPREMRLALAVAAVNFAYFQKQDEPFREPFLRRLGFSTDAERLDRIFNPSVGMPVERAVEEWSGRRNPRSGPFRWVGLIREQAGLPKHRLGKFAEWLGKMRSEVGWANLSGFSDQRIQDDVAAGFVGSWYAKEFLGSEAGVEFIRSVCDDLIRFFDEGRLARAELADLPFYRRGFMLELVGELERQDAGGGTVRETRSSPYHDPYFAFDPDLGELVVRFDYEEVLRGRIRCDQYRGGALFEPAVSVGEQLPLREWYTGRRSVPHGEHQEWSAPGWDPSAALATVFDLAGPLVWRTGDGRTVGQGEYLLITRDSIRIPQSMVIAERTTLFVEGTSPSLYRVLHVQLAPGDRIDSIDLRVGGLPKLPLLAAVRGEPWASFASLDAVWQPGRARIKLLNWTPENAARFHVMLRVGEQTRRLHIRAGDQAEIDLSDLPAPTIGIVYLESVGRRSLAAESVRRMSFAVWPPLRLQPPRELVPEGEPATVGLHLSGGVSFDPMSASGNKSNVATENALTVPPPELVLRGTIRYRTAKLVLHLPVRRARLRTSDAPDQPLVLDPKMLRQMHEAYLGGSPRFLRLWALPGREVDLFLSSVDGSSAPLLRSKRIPPSGDTEIRPGELKDALLQGSIDLGRFMVRDGERFVPTETYYIDTDSYCRDPLQQDARASLPMPLATGLEAIWRVQNNLALDALDLSAVAPTSLRERAARFSYGSMVLDGRRPATGTLVNVPQPVRRRLRALKGLLDRVQKVRAASDTSARARTVLTKWAAVDPVLTLRNLDLSLPRWDQKLSALRDQLQKLADVSGRFDRFKSMCSDENIPGDDVPRPLLVAGRFYARAEREPPSTARQRISEAAQRLTSARQNLPAPWSEVAELLRALAVLRLCKITEFAAIVKEMSDLQYGQGAQAQLRAIRANLRDGRLDGLPAHPSFDLASISPRTDDARLAAALIGGVNAGHAWGSAAEVCWIAAWLGWRASRNGTNQALDAEHLRTAILRLADRIPATADRDRLLTEVRTNSPGAWT